MNVIASSETRNVLAQEILDVRSIYIRQGLYNSIIRSSLQEIIQLNKFSWSIFHKGVNTL